MILDEITLHNFAGYGGRQTIHLTPQPKKPIILFGGLNGGGKTTILDAMQLVLYGKRARCSNRGNLSYEDFIRKAFHRTQHGSLNEAAIELQFRSWSQGEEKTYYIHRSWVGHANSVREDLEISCNGKIDLALTESWPEYVEGFIPSGISHLFLFDGERIEKLATPETSAGLLKTAMQGLLGLDLVEQLNSDLIVLERRKKAEKRSDVEAQQVKRIENEVEDLQARYLALEETIAPMRTQLGRTQKLLKDTTDQLSRQGGDLLEQQNDLEAGFETCKAQVTDSTLALVQQAEGAAPFLLVPELFRSLCNQDRNEQLAEQDEILQHVLESRDKKLLKALKQKKLASNTLDFVSGFLQSDRDNRNDSAETDCYLQLTRETRLLLHRLEEQDLLEEHGRTRGMIDDLNRRLEDLARQERLLAAVPEVDSVVGIVEKKNTLQHEHTKLESQIEALESEKQKLSAEHERAKLRLEKALDQIHDQVVEEKTTLRLLQHTKKVRDTIALFQTRLVEQRVSQIESLVLDAYQTLLRKNKLVGEISISPENFSVSLKDHHSRPLDTDRLSAGERQLLAVSLLWAFAKASGRPLPAIIDTPLGRLDSEHRRHMVKHYFPAASHQVILLSTDEEIDEEHLNSLKPFVAHSYLLAHDDNVGSTQIQPGYFW
jgi:DNA sulfur modification protein DndD